MADPKDTKPKDPIGTADTSPTDSVKSGPVKPPVLDLKARPAEAKPTSKADPKKPEPTKSVDDKSKPAEATTAKPVPPTPPRSQPATGLAFGAAIAGGVIGLAAAYGLAAAGLWPTPPAPTPTADPRIAQFGSVIPELQTVTGTTQSELATLTRRVATLEAAPAPATAAPAAAPTDLGPLESQLTALSTRLDSLAAEPAAATDTTAIETLRTEIAGITTRLDELGARIGSAEANLRTLDTTVAETSATVARQPTDIGAVLQLPLILSGFEAAFASGRPYETELASLRAALPSASIPTDIANAATTGLPRPDVIATQFAEVLPAILAGRPAEPNADWQDGAMDWFRSAIALRPTGEMAGDTPEAIASRLEGAIARRDFAAAQTLFAALPAPMLAAAGDVPKLVAQQASAANFLETLRTQALSGEAKP